MTDIVEKNYELAKILAKDYAISLMEEDSFGQSMISKQHYKYGWLCKPDYWNKMFGSFKSKKSGHINIKTVEDIIKEHNIDLGSAALTLQVANLVEEDIKDHAVASYLIDAGSVPVACIFQMDENHPSCWVYLEA